MIVGLQSPSINCAHPRSTLLGMLAAPLAAQRHRATGCPHCCNRRFQGAAVCVRHQHTCLCVRGHPLLDCTACQWGLDKRCVPSGWRMGRQAGAHMTPAFLPSFGIPLKTNCRPEGQPQLGTGARFRCAPTHPPLNRRGHGRATWATHHLPNFDWSSLLMTF